MSNASDKGVLPIRESSCVKRYCLVPRLRKGISRNEWAYRGAP